ncbi:MAG: hypothetical protein IT337_02525 [Thermomicrobiales bacterium]|nr:hypothetical protein [Thermomicrobiales bacterium]
MSATEPDVLAAIDIGTNTIKLTVARREPDGRVVEFASDVDTVRLGQGMAATGRLAEDRMEAALAAIDRFARLARAKGAQRVLAVATEATRATANGSDFLRRAAKRTGVEVQVIDGAREAELTFRGVAARLPLTGKTVIADVGGGSTETIVVENARVLRSASTSLGSGRLTDRFVTLDPPGADAIAECRTFARDVLAESADVGRLPSGVGVRLVLVGGTGEFLAKLVGRGPVMSPLDLGPALAVLATTPAADLAVRLGAQEARARVLPAGVAIAAALADLTRPDAIVATSSGVRTGLLLEAFAADRALGATSPPAPSTTMRGKGTSA